MAEIVEVDTRGARGVSIKPVVVNDADQTGVSESTLDMRLALAPGLDGSTRRGAVDVFYLKYSIACFAPREAAVEKFLEIFGGR